MIQWFPQAACVLAAWCAQQGSTTVQQEVSVRLDHGPVPEQEWAEESVPDSFGAGGLRARVDVGCSPGAARLRLSLAGARPFSSAVLELGVQHGSSLAGVRREVLRTDGEGRASILVDGALPGALGARFVASPQRGPTQRSAILGLPGGPGTQAVFSGQRGDIVITEIMKDPSFVTDAHGEWFEIKNITSRTINIAGWHITDLGSNSHTILNGTQPIYLSPGQNFVLGIDDNPLTNGGINVDYKYSNFTLGNGADSILLTARSGYLVDEVDYDDGIFWPDTPGKSLSLHPFPTDVYFNDDPANWCEGKTLIGGGNTDLGTPHLDNDTCP